MPIKSVTLNGTLRQIAGLDDLDPYYASITDRFEASFEDFSARYLRPDYICWDIGANIGVTALMMAGLCPDGHVTAVEANRPVFDLLQRNLADNDVRNVTAVHCAIGDRNGRTLFNEQSAYGHIASFGTSVTMLNPDTLLARTDGRLPDFIKIDCEGFKPMILRSAADLIWRSNALVHFEFNSWCLLHHSRSQPLDFLEWVINTFPETFIVRDGGTLERFVLQDISRILHDNLMKYGCLNDIVVTFDASRVA
ncbi:FkbM family methyltransferase [Methylobacterium sp. SyP6R]|uniref:FkbM family methyltransferase n=1 Tax=Methylobacterium sp. SyP6R TaxID=2718876 RepID=UPI001F014BAD|nr:FkbM family methyltransferase [Methylobacterium sp. SyP6R]MCF4130219.1 FkbM family methyltransferase [Methylobacterium sp. SyP6R]